MHPFDLTGQRLPFPAEPERLPLELLVEILAGWTLHPEYRRVRDLAEGIAEGVATRISRGQPLYLILDADIAMNLGTILREDLGIRNEILVIDGVALWNFDYIDLGRMREPSNTVPVMIKSLVFKDVSGGGRRMERMQSRQAGAGRA